MANSDKNIVITPFIGSTTSDPQIVFSGASSTLGPQNITLKAYPTSNGTLSFEGSAGQLFSITNDLTGTIFSVNDVSGIPSIEVSDTGLIKLAQYSGNVLLGTGTDSGTDKLQVNGSIRISGYGTIINSAGQWIGDPTGLQGRQGIQGTLGVQGIQGTLGVQGIQGTLGVQGIQGTLGVQGIQGTLGNQGVQGIQGRQGVQGTLGNQGIQGTLGNQGVQGIQGTLGNQGVQGIQGTLGIQGIQGTLGIQGVQGIQGTLGIQGIQGIQGTLGIQGVQGTLGAQGIQGVQGIQGRDGNFGGATFDYTFDTTTTNADPGIGKLRFNNANVTLATQLYIDDQNDASTDIQTFLRTIDDSTSTIKGHYRISNKFDASDFALFTISALTEQTGYFVVDSAYVSGSATAFTNLEDVIITFARTGDMGSQGSQGIQGIQGNQGVQGTLGNQGIQGTLGNQGVQGIQGTLGIQGVQGIQGTLGIQGIQGTAIQGTQGVQGIQGRQGIQGTAIQGTQGVQGIQGIQGTAIQGTQGVQGIQGTAIQGTQGVQGTAVQGTQGVQGIQGITGTTGDKGGVRYSFTTTATDADPGNGVIAYNNATIASVTNLFIDNLDASGVTQTAWYDTWDDSTTTTDRGFIYIVGNLAGSTVVNIFRVTGAVVVATGYYKIPVAYVSGALPVNAAILQLAFSRTGNIGVQGIQGTLGNQGIQGTLGNQGIQGTLGNQGVQGIQGTAIQGTLGNQGIQGVQGTAIQGTLGNQGIQGTLGNQGVQGVQGTAIQGTQGVQGTAIQGTQGVQGRQGITGTGLTWQVQSTNYTASNLDAIVANTSGGPISITLPASPVAGTMVTIADGGNWATNNLTVLRGTNTIENLAENLVLDINDVRVDFVYSGTTWQVYANIGQRGIQGTTGSGSQGIQGTLGSQGIQGTAIQGTQGAGSQGIQGTLGSQGIQGISGAGGGGSVTIADDTATNATRYVGFVSTTSGTATTLNVSSTKLYFNPSTGTLNATLFNSLSDTTLKTDLTKIDDAVSIINKIQGFRFKWKEGGGDSMGVSAQEIEQVLPELVSTDEFKSVNYNGLIAVLIEAVKELSKEIRTNG